MPGDPTETLARTLWGEARGCGASGMSRVCSVILNRARYPRWWGRDIASVCTAPWQFSCWNEGDPNRAKLLAVTDFDTEFRVALDIAAKAVAGALPDLTGGADSYFALTMASPPAWRTHAVHTLDDGWHSFWITRNAAHAPQAYQPRPVGADNSSDALNAAVIAAHKET